MSKDRCESNRTIVDYLIILIIDEIGFINGTGITACCCGTDYCSSPALYLNGTPSMPTTTTTMTLMTTGASTTTSTAISVIASAIVYCFGRYFNHI